ncbi:ATP-dependent DNA helicase PIF2-like, partial [Acyrthosiphon pisum]|uniref:ATP-dependent DNA helicase n=1 Tax=Acyrthosiphon pisum TaxID=7029 RepID=A0A8R2FDL2_ACYPI
DGNKLLTAEDVDDVVCAELPDPADENNQRLFTAVTSHMIHGPCGQLNRNSPCMAEGICLKKYPKAYSAETVYVSDGGYPTYRRRDNGIEALVRGHQISNEFVVAYNPYLLAKYDAHINVEVCSTVKSVKYLYKYVFKGHDMATVEVQDRNEIEKLRDEDRARAACLDAIGRLLQGHGKTLADYGLPNPDVALLEEDAGGDVYAFVDAVVRWTLQLDNLNDEQRAVYDRVMAAVDDNRDVPKLFYVDGPGGTGKTTLYGCLIWSLRNMARSVLSVAFTGIAATLMDGGMTVHSTFGLPFGTLNEDSTSSIAMQSLRARRIREAALIVWDEAPMSPGLQLTVVDRLLKDIMQSELPFGGKTVLFAGDFRQILPVVRRGTRAAIVAASIRHHHLWDVFERFSLTQNMRANNDADFAAWLLQLGNGQLPAVDGNVNTVEIPRNMVCDIANLIDFVYPQQMSLANVDEFARKIILCPRNEDCRQVNRTVLQRVTGAARTYTAIDTVVADDVDEIANYPTEFLNSLEPDGLPPYRLTLVVGSVVMLLRNLDPKIRLCNGTRLVVTELRRNNFKARLLADAGEGQDDIVIPRIPLSSSGDDDLPFTMRRVQFP